MKDLKIGDRVRAYDAHNVYTGRIQFHEGDCIRLKIDKSVEGSVGFLFHPNQCRKLKPKPKRKPREWWIAFRNDTGIFSNIKSSNPHMDPKKYQVFHVREVLKKDPK